MNADRPDSELWAELQLLQPLGIALGCASLLVGRCLAAWLPVFPAVKAKVEELGLGGGGGWIFCFLSEKLGNVWGKRDTYVTKKLVTKPM